MVLKSYCAYVLRLSGHSGFLRILPPKTAIFFAQFIRINRKGYQNPKRKLGVTTHFSEIIELKFGKKNAIHALYFNAFLELSLLSYI